jgi:hypothetical protein
LRQLLIGVLLILTAPGAFAQDCRELEKSKKLIYGFKPPQLTDEQRTAKSKEMDKFWEQAKAQKDSQACIKQLLEAESANAFFLYDGAQLLMRLDKSQSVGTLQTVAKAIGRSDLNDVDLADYLQTVRMLDAKGIDTAALADKYITASQADAFIPQHSLKVDRSIGAVFLYGTMAPEKVDDRLIPLLQSSNPEIKSAVIYMLSLNMSARSFTALKSLQGLNKKDQQMVDSVLIPREVKTKPKSKYTREQILAKLMKFPEMDESDFVDGEDKEIDNSILLTLMPEDVNLFRQARSKGITGISDESLYRYFDLSRLLMGLINKHNLYAEARKVEVKR